MAPLVIPKEKSGYQSSQVTTVKNIILIILNDVTSTRMTRIFIQDKNWYLRS